MSLMENKKKILLNEPHLETIEQQGVRFDTDMRAPLKSCRVEFSPIQEGSGDPAPDNVRPIKGTTDVPVYHMHKSLVHFNQYVGFRPHDLPSNNTYYNGFGYWSPKITYFNNLVGKKLTYSVYINAVEAQDDKANGVRVWAQDAQGNYIYQSKQGNLIAQGEAGWSMITITIPENMANIAFGLTLSEYSVASYPRVEFGETGSDLELYVENLLPSGSFTKTMNGITATYYSDGSVHLEGTADGNFFFNLPASFYFTITPGVYGLSGQIPNSNVNIYLVVSSANGGDIKFIATSVKAIDFTDTEARIQISVVSGKTVNTTITPRLVQLPDVETVLPDEGYSLMPPSMKNLLDITQYSYRSAPQYISVNKDYINISQVVASNSTHIKFSQEFPPGTYTFSAQCSGEGFGGLSVLFSSALPGGEWNNTYQGYWKATTGNTPVLTFTLLETSTIGIIIRTNPGHVNESARIDHIQVEAGSSATTYEPYTDAATYCIMPVMKNLLDIQAYSSKANNVTVSLGTLEASPVGSGNGSMIKFAQQFVPGTYTFSANGAGTGFGGIRLLFSTEVTGGTWNDYYNGYWINLPNTNTLTFTLNEKTSLGLVFLTKSGYEQDSATISDIQLESGSSATSYEPYRTIYGGWVDLVTGVVCKTWDIVNLGDCTWTRIANPYTDLASTYIFYASLQAVTGHGAKQLYNGLTSAYKWVNTSNYMDTDKTAGTIYYTNIAIRDDSYTDTNDFKAAMNGVYLAYELETPIYYQLTPDQLKTFKNTNTIWGNTNGNTIVQYWTH